MLGLGKRHIAGVAGGDPPEPGRAAAPGVGTRSRKAGRTAALGSLLAGLALAAAGCASSSSDKPASTTAAVTQSATQAPATSTTSAANTAASTTAAATASNSATDNGLSGEWKGQYSGAYNGTFVLHWQQSGSSLGGKITISSPQSTLDVNGTLHGGAISFGTVGSLAITYTGSVSGGSMSGSYQTPGGGGQWSATKG